MTILWVGWGMIMGWTVLSNSLLFRVAVCREMHVKYKKSTQLCHVFADSSLLQSIEGAHLDCVIKNHPALDSMMHLLPENVLVSGDENIPGLAASPTGKAHVTGSKMSNALLYNNRLSFKRLEDLCVVLCIRLLWNKQMDK